MRKIRSWHYLPNILFLSHFIWHPPTNESECTSSPGFSKYHWCTKVPCRKPPTKFSSITHPDDRGWGICQFILIFQMTNIVIYPWEALSIYHGDPIMEKCWFILWFNYKAYDLIWVESKGICWFFIHLLQLVGMTIYPIISSISWVLDRSF